MLTTEIRELTNAELDHVAGGNPLVVAAAGFMAGYMVGQVLDDAGVGDAIDFKKMEEYAKSKSKGGGSPA